MAKKEYPKAEPKDYPKDMLPESEKPKEIKDVEKCEKKELCKEKSCKSCGVMVKIRKEKIKKAIDRLQNIMKTLDSMDDVAKSMVLENFDRLMNTQKSFLDQSIENLDKIKKSF